MKPSTNENSNKKADALRRILNEYSKVAIAFSGGVDSTFLLDVAYRTLGKDRVLALTAVGSNFAAGELTYAEQFCTDRGISHKTLSPNLPLIFWENPSDRCYHCKKAILSCMKEFCGDYWTLMDGTNLDDAADYRPGRRALEEAGIVSPLCMVGLTKSEIRSLLRAQNIDIWNKPAFACLASRVPYGEQITAEKLSAIYKMEMFLTELGFLGVRVRHHGSLARIEVAPADRTLIGSDALLMDSIAAKAKESGFLYVALDLEGYRMGSLNDTVLKL